MSGIKKPLLCISAVDDPIVHPGALPKEQSRANENILLAVTARGGHVSFLEGLWPSGASYSDKLTVEFIKFIVQRQTVNATPPK